MIPEFQSSSEPPPGWDACGICKIRGEYENGARFTFQTREWKRTQWSQVSDPETGEIKNVAEVIVEVLAKIAEPAYKFHKTPQGVLHAFHFACLASRSFCVLCATSEPQRSSSRRPNSRSLALQENEVKEDEERSQGVIVQEPNPNQPLLFDDDKEDDGIQVGLSDVSKKESPDLLHLDIEEEEPDPFSAHDDQAGEKEDGVQRVVAQGEVVDLSDEEDRFDEEGNLLILVKVVNGLAHVALPKLALSL